MPEFPSKEADVLALVKIMIAGYRTHGADFPSISWYPLLIWKNNYYIARTEWGYLRSKALLATQKKNESLTQLTQLMKSCLKKSEVDVAGSPEKLAQIGWGPKRVSQPIEIPGQPKSLRIIAEGPGAISLIWGKPTVGGAVRNYIIQKRQQTIEENFGPWKLAATAFQNHITLTDQLQRIQLEYRVKAVNISGESTPSNTIAAIL